MGAKGHRQKHADGRAERMEQGQDSQEGIV